MFHKFALISILIIALFLRFYQLESVPVGFHRDEAYLGYNAYSILKTGKDMSGNIMPLHLKSFLFSPAGYSYASIPFIAIFGLDEFSVRFASALFGTLTIFLVYLLVKNLFKKYRYKTQLSLISAFLIAISPWHINLSRVATENVLVVFFITLGVYLYLKWLSKSKLVYILFAFLSFGITLIIYQAPRAFLPLFLPLLIFAFLKRVNIKKILLPSILYALIVVFPILLILNSHDLTQRIRMLSIFQHPQTQLILDEQIREDGNIDNTLATRVFHNKLFNYSSTFIQNFAKHFDFDFLFFDTGFPDRYRIPQMGLIYIVEFLFILFGIYRLVQKEKRLSLFLIGWVMIAPVGSALTFDDIPNLQRTLIVFPAISIITAYGYLEFWKNFKFRFSKLVKSILILLILYNFVYYLHQYYTHQIYHRPWFRQEGYKELVSKIDKLLPRYKEVVVTSSESSPEIFFLFYKKYDPNMAQSKLSSEKINSKNFYLDKYHFVNDECPLMLTSKTDPATHITETIFTGKKDILYVNHGNCDDLDVFSRTLDVVKRSDETTVFKIIEAK